MSTLNQVMLIGRAGKDPDIRAVGDNRVASFSLAVSEKYKDRNGESRENTEWVNIVAWRNLADLCDNYVKKASELYVQGKLRTREYTDASGVKKYTTEVVADNIQLLGSRPQGQHQVQSARAQAPARQQQQPLDDYARQRIAAQPANSDNPEDDLPF